MTAPEPSFEAQMEKARDDLDKAIENLMRLTYPQLNEGITALSAWALATNFTRYDVQGNRISICLMTASLQSDMPTTFGLFSAGQLWAGQVLSRGMM